MLKNLSVCLFNQFLGKLGGNQDAAIFSRVLNGKVAYSCRATASSPINYWANLPLRSPEKLGEDHCSVAPGRAIILQ